MRGAIAGRGGGGVHCGHKAFRQGAASLHPHTQSSLLTCRQKHSSPSTVFIEKKNLFGAKQIVIFVTSAVS